MTKLMDSCSQFEQQMKMYQYRWSKACRRKPMCLQFYSKVLLTSSCPLIIMKMGRKHDLFSQIKFKGHYILVWFSQFWLCKMLYLDILMWLMLNRLTGGPTVCFLKHQRFSSWCHVIILNNTLFSSYFYFGLLHSNLGRKCIILYIQTL